MDLARLLDPEGPHARVAAVAVLGAMVVGGCTLTGEDEVGLSSRAAAKSVDPQRTAAVREAVRCDLGEPIARAAQLPVAGAEPVTSITAHQKTARAVVEDDFLFLPAVTWDERRIDASTVRFTSSHNGRVRAAVVVVRDEEGWAWDAIAQCDQAEFPPSSDRAAGVVVWTDARGSRVSTRSVHTMALSRSLQQCFGERVQIVEVDGVRYVSDPLHSFQGTTHGSYREVVALPGDAADTGFRSEGAALWRGKDRNSVYLVEANNTRRLPRQKEGPPNAC